MHIVLAAAAESDTATSAQTLTPVGFGLAAFGILVGLLLLTVAFRNAGHRH